MNKFKNIILSLLFSSFFINISYAIIDKNAIVPISNSIVNPGTGTGTGILDSIFKTIVDYTFGLLALVVVAMFIYVGYLFITSSGNEEQFKKAWKTFMYAVVGLVVVSLSWGIVKLITTIGI